MTVQENLDRALFAALADADLEAAQETLLRNADPDAQHPETNEPALVFVVENIRPDKVAARFADLLLRHKADAGAENSAGLTVLMLAALNGMPETADAILACGDAARLTARHPDMGTALDIGVSILAETPEPDPSDPAARVVKSLDNMHTLVERYGSLNEAFREVYAKIEGIMDGIEEIADAVKKKRAPAPEPLLN